MKAGRGVLAAAVVLSVAAICLGQAVLASPPFWATSYGGDRLEMGYSVQQTVDGGYILLGVTLSKGAGQRDAWLIKTDDKGKPLWDSTFGGGKDDWGRCVRQTVDGGYILAGSTFSLGAGQADAWLIKTDASGAKQWERVFGGSEVDLGCAVQQTDDGGYVLVGWTESKGAGSADAWAFGRRGGHVANRCPSGAASLPSSSSRNCGHVSAYTSTPSSAASEMASTASPVDT